MAIDASEILIFLSIIDVSYMTKKDRQHKKIPKKRLIRQKARIDKEEEYYINQC
jgi:hypothetical protein